MNYKEALKEGFFEMQTSRDWYREVTFNVGMHASLVEFWIRTSVLLVTPIAPHFAEHVWTELLGERDSVQNALFPESRMKAVVVAGGATGIDDDDDGEGGLADAAALEAGIYMRNTIKMIRDAEILAQKKNAKGVKGGGGGATGAGAGAGKEGKKAVRIFVATRFPEWQDVSVQIVKESFDERTGVVDDVKVREGLTKKGLMKDKKVMPFVQAFKVGNSFT